MARELIYTKIHLWGQIQREGRYRSREARPEGHVATSRSMDSLPRVAGASEGSKQRGGGNRCDSL